MTLWRLRKDADDYHVEHPAGVAAVMPVVTRDPPFVSVQSRQSAGQVEHLLVLTLCSPDQGWVFHPRGSLLRSLQQDWLHCSLLHQHLSLLRPQHGYTSLSLEGSQLG